MSIDKITLRSEILLKRRNLKKIEWEEKNEQILTRVESLDIFQSAQHILFYYGVKNEVDPVPLAHQCIKMGKKVYFPFIDSENDVFHAGHVSNIDTDMELGTFDIMEPKKRVATDIQKLDLIFVPGVAFDLTGNRIGMGKGFYDKFFHQFRDPNHISKRVGLGFDFQMVEALPTEEFDEVVGWLVSESKIHKCS